MEENPIVRELLDMVDDAINTDDIAKKREILLKMKSKIE